MISSATMIVTGLNIGELEKSTTVFESERYCAITGEQIEKGYFVKEITTSATNEFMDTFRGDPCGVVSESVGRAFRNDHNMGARLFFEDGTSYYPLISRESAAKDGCRPCWSDLVRDVWPARRGQSLLCLLTTDSKKRLWPRARVGALGSATPIYLHDNKTGISASIDVDWNVLVNTLATIEAVYQKGFPKSAIREGLYGCQDHLRLLGYKHVSELERECKQIRNLVEFAPALLIAQKQLEETK